MTESAVVGEVAAAIRWVNIVSVWVQGSEFRVQGKWGMSVCFERVAGRIAKSQFFLPEP